MTFPYVGRHAELYDVFYGDKPYTQEASWINQHLLSAAPTTQRVLDVACGTGRHSIALASLGYQVVGVDISESMILRARTRAEGADLAVKFEVRDMRRLGFESGLFDSALCLFDSIGYARTDEGVLAALRSIATALRPGGLFVLEFWQRSPMVRLFDPVRVRRWETPEGLVLRVSETDLDLARNLAEVTYTVVEFRSDGSTPAFEETQVNRFFTVPEMEAFVTSTGMSPVGWFSGFSEEPVNEDAWHVVGLVRKE